MSAQETPIRVDIVSDVVCPWCVIGYHQLARAAKQAGLTLDIQWHPFELNPHMVAEGENLRAHLAAKYGTTPEGSRKARASLTDMGRELGFTFNYADDMRMWNTFKAHQLIQWAEQHGQGHATNMALFAAYFTDRLNVSNIEVLVQIASNIGLDSGAARKMLEDGSQAEATRDRQRVWQQRGVQGVPAMVFQERYLVSGAQGVEAYGQILAQLLEERAA